MERKLNILFVNSYLNAGGITRYILYLATELVGRGHQVWVASSGGEWEEKFKKNGISLVKIPLNTKAIFSPKILTSFLELRRFLKTQQIDLIHSHKRVSQCLASLVSAFTKIPHITTFHGFYRLSFMRRLLKFDGTRAIAISKATANHIQDDLGISNQKLRVVYNGVTLEDLAPPGPLSELKEKYKVKGSPIIGMMARLKPEKNHQLTIAALGTLVKKFPDIVLLIPGEGSLKPKLKKMVIDRCLEKNVQFFDTVEPLGMYKMMDIFIHPATSEGFGLAIIEAQMVGVPVIATDVDGIREIVVDKISGLLIKNPHNEAELADKISYLLKNPETAAGLVKKGTHRAYDIFSISKMTDGILEVYKEVLNR